MREATLPIRHWVLGLPGATLEEATTVWSHPAAFDQCRELFADWNVKCVPAATTADAARHVSETGDPAHVAIASTEAADEYGLTVIADDVGDSPGAFTRFVALAPYTQVGGGEGWRTAISFVTDHQPGALFRALGPLARNNVNLVQLVSRPLPNSPWRYRFDVVLDGHVFDPSVRPALARAARADARAAPLRVLRRGARAVSAHTLFRKIWDAHVVAERDDAPSLLYVDLHLVHEVTSPQAFEALRLAGRPVRRPDLTVATMDHNVPTLDGPITDPLARDAARGAAPQLRGVRRPPVRDRQRARGDRPRDRPELGLTQPGMTIVCGDSHTSTHGAFGALAFGIGTSEVEHVLATQTLPQAQPKTMQVAFDGELPFGLSAKDMVLAAIGQLGVAGGQGHVLEYTGAAIERALDGGPDDGLQHVDRGRRAGRDDRARRHDLRLPRGPARRAERRGVGAGARRVARALRTDDGASYDDAIVVDVAQLKPQVTWGTNPGMVVPVDGVVPIPADYDDPDRARGGRARAALHGSDARARRSSTCASTRCSSARARTRASRTCARPRRSSPAGMSRTACRRSSCRAPRR